MNKKRLCNKNRRISVMVIHVLTTHEIQDSSDFFETTVVWCIIIVRNAMQQNKLRLYNLLYIIQGLIILLIRHHYSNFSKRSLFC